MKRLLCPSLMCADFEHLADEVQALERAGADIFHVDIMDGAFVPNFAMGLEDFRTVRKNAECLVDVHLMCQAPGVLAPLFAKAGADIVYVHAETESANLGRILDEIHKEGAWTGLAVNPGTSAESVKALLPIVDYLLVMTVNPGFAGQKYLDYVDEKLETFLDWKGLYEYQIVVDGAISPEKVRSLSRRGVDGFVLGTSALFGKGDYAAALSSLRKDEEA